MLSGLVCSYLFHYQHAQTVLACLLACPWLAGGGDLVRQRASPFDVTRPSSAKHNMDYYSMFSATSPILQDVALLAVLRCGGAL